MTYKELANKLKKFGCEEIPRRGKGSHFYKIGSLLKTPYFFASILTNSLHLERLLYTNLKAKLSL